MSARDAAVSLYENLQPAAWLRMIGVGKTSSGEDVLIAYVDRVSSQVKTRVPERWEGFPVQIKQMSKPVPAGV
jgi:hypothetical protein